MSQTTLEVNELVARMIDLPRGIVPTRTARITVGVDLGKFLSHWIAVSWSPNPATGHVLDYGRVEVASESLGVEQAIMVALRELEEMFMEGWPIGSAEGERATNYERLLVNSSVPTLSTNNATGTVVDGVLAPRMTAAPSASS